MARIRTIKPSFFSSLAMAEHPLSTRLTYIGLWTYCDDEGRGVDDPRLVKAEVWPLDDDMTPKKVAKELDRLADSGQILRYEVNGRRYLQVTEWKDHQRINRPTPSKHPVPLDDEYVIPTGAITEQDVNAHGGLTEPSPPEGKGREGNRDNPPTPHEHPPVDNELARRALARAQAFQQQTHPTGDDAA